jgi:ketosteroid isomerase-like protein
MTWAQRHLDPDGEAALDLLHTSCGKQADPYLACSHCHEPLTARDTARSCPEMPATTADVLRSQFAAFAEGGLDAVARHWHPDIEWRAVEGAADDVGLIAGEQALRRYYADWSATLDALRADVDAVLLEDGERVAVAVRNAGRGRTSGVPVRGRYYVACLVRDGRIVAGREYATAEEAVAGARSLRWGANP